MSATLFHGTKPEYAEAVQADGLRPGSYLSSSLDEALSYGSVLYEVDVTGLPVEVQDEKTWFVALDGVSPERMTRA